MINPVKCKTSISYHVILTRWVLAIRLFTMGLNSQLIVNLQWGEGREFRQGQRTNCGLTPHSLASVPSLPLVCPISKMAPIKQGVAEGEENDPLPYVVPPSASMELSSLRCHVERGASAHHAWRTQHACGVQRRLVSIVPCSAVWPSPQQHLSP